MDRPKILLYLHHMDLGQRYPIANHEVIIGRSTGHILFPKDEKMSAQHCRIFEDRGRVYVRDLGSTTGTRLDGRLLSPEKLYPLKENNVLAVGSQTFRCIEPSVAKPLRKKKKKREDTESSFASDMLSFMAMALIAVAGYFAYKHQLIKLPAMDTPQVAQPEPPLTSPFELVYRDLRATLDSYNQLGASVRSGEKTEKQMAGEIRNRLIPALNTVVSKLAVVRPANEWERRRLEANTKLAQLALAQVTLMAKQAETRNPNLNSEIERVSAELEKVAEQARSLNERAPSSN